jgi:energy-coupling factor transporter ATP-binding protein EcfA2
MTGDQRFTSSEALRTGGCPGLMEPEPPIIATTALGSGIRFSRKERERHLYIVGKSGSGKSTVLFNLAMQDIIAGEGIAIVDPHGDLAEAIVDAIPPERTHEVCYFNVADTEHPVGFNPLARMPRKRHALAAAGIVAAFKHLWGESWGPRLEHHLFHGVAALLESPRPTITDLARIYTDEDFRSRLIPRIADPVIARFWTGEYASYDKKFQAEAASPILNKVGQITASPILRNILGQVTPKFDLSHAMHHRGIFIANLAKGRIGEQASNLLGSLLISHLQLIAMARSELAPEYRAPFFVHVDEFQSFSTAAFASLLSEARKFATHFSLANQYTEQLTDNVRAAVLGNAGTLMVFRVSAADAEILAPEFHPLPPNELVDQSPHRAWLRRCDGDQRPVFLSPPQSSSKHRREIVIAQSRRNFGRPRALIERNFNT